LAKKRKVIINELLLRVTEGTGPMKSSNHQAMLDKVLNPAGKAICLKDKRRKALFL
jgi:hypothetical protein